MSRLGRSRRGLAVMAVIAVIFFIGRILWANGVFSAAPGGFLGSCKLVARVPGIQDIEIVNGLVFVAVGSDRGPDRRDGLYLYSDSGGLKKLPGSPADFHPRGIGSYRSPNGSGIFLLAVNRWPPGRSPTSRDGRFSVDSFEVTQPQTHPVLVAQGTVEGGLLTDPQDVAAAGPGAFYVSNNRYKQGVARLLAAWGILPGSDILYFNGMFFRTVAEDVYQARGLALTPDGSHLLAASMTARSLRSFTREPFTGNLSDAGSVSLPGAPDKIVMDESGALWVAVHANLLHWRDFLLHPGARPSSEILRVALLNGVPQQSQQVYGNAGSQIAGASVGASSGGRLLLGSSRDGRLLECTGP